MFSLPNRKTLPALLALVLLVLTIASCKNFFVDAKLTSITLIPATQTLVVGNSQQLTATGTYDDGSTKALSGSGVSWISSNMSSASVSTSGLVKAISTNGNPTASVTITVAAGTVSATSNITVSNAAITGISIGPNPLHVSLGSTGNLIATATFADGTTANVSAENGATWVPTDSTVATLSAATTTPPSELVTPVKNGSTVVTFTFSGFSPTATVLVP